MYTMKVHFKIEYRTQWGEEVRLQILGREYSLTTEDGKFWQGSIDIPRTETDHTVSYLYALYRNSALVWTEWEGAPHRLFVPSLPAAADKSERDVRINITDLWRPIPEDLPLYSSAYTECVAPHTHRTFRDLPQYEQTLQLRVLEPRLSREQHLGIVGDIAQLGNWQQAVRLDMIAIQEWCVNIDASRLVRPIEYKYVVLDEHDEIIQWEEGPNRQIAHVEQSDGLTTIVNDFSPRFSLPKWKCAGCVIPVFSLRSQNSYGIGDFGDLQRFIAWAATAGMHAVQILPINDTTTGGSWLDSYPYNAISIYALHPIYLNLSALPTLTDRLKMETFLIRQQELNAASQLDYERVFALKMEYLHLLYEQECLQKSPKEASVLQRKDFKEYFKQNQYWLVTYAAFCYLRDHYAAADYRCWPSPYNRYDEQTIARLTAPRSKQYPDIAFYYFTQFLLHLQLTEVHEKARQAGVILKGDIPIGISRCSVEAWAEPSLFNLDAQTGAPPDDFSVNGQNWGFPTYNWEAMQKDNCQWWERRFKKMAEFFDAYRIDHVLGFFRIWEIPSHAVHGLLGQFSPALPMHTSEINRYGLRFCERFMIEPFINDDVLLRQFGYRAELVKTLYLDADIEKTKQANQTNEFDGICTFYRFKEKFNTQRKVEAAFAGKENDDDISLRDGLYQLLSDVLFVRDRQHPQMFHPRITGQLTHAYRALDNVQKQAYNAIYNDYFFSRHNHYWYEEAMRKLPHLTQSTRMLVCAEDLGMVPACVPWVMEQLRILTLEIQTMPKAYGVEFGLPDTYPYRSVCTISTHDMATLRMWWEEDPERAQRLFNHALHIDGNAPQPLPAWLAEEIIRRHLYSPSMLCILSLQDWLSIDERLRNPQVASERINNPSNPHHYWRWRMHVSIDALEQEKTYTEHLRNLIQRTGR